MTRAGAVFAIVLVAVTLTGCKRDEIDAERKQQQDAAIQTCRDRGGVPVLDWAARMTDCKFNPQEARP